MPADWTKLIDVAAVNAALKELKTKMADKKISESKSATASLTEIRKSIKEELAAVVKNRARAIEILKEIHTDAKAIHSMVESRKLSKSKLDAYPTGLSKLSKEMNQLTFPFAGLQCDSPQGGSRIRGVDAVDDPDLGADVRAGRRRDEQRTQEGPQGRDAEAREVLRGRAEGDATGLGCRGTPALKGSPTSGFRPGARASARLRGSGSATHSSP
jgi:hypothetical protein